jgi:hypothetical protein
MQRDESGVVKNDKGNVVSVKLDRHVLDPESDEAVQVTSDARDNPSPVDALLEGPPSFESKDDDPDDDDE